MADNKQEEKKEKLSFKITQPPPFESLIQTIYTDSASFCTDVINPVFHAICHDFYGSKITIGQNRMIMTSVYFSEPIGKEDNGKAHVIERVLSPEALKDIDTRIKMVNGTLGVGGVGQDRYKNQYKLTQDGKDLLSNIIPSAVKSNNGKINWKQIVTEGSLTNTFSYSGNNQVYIEVMIDINKLVKQIYGSKDQNTGETYQYMVTLGNPINPIAAYGGNMIVKQWQLFIVKLSGSVIDRVAKSYGMSGQNSLGIIT